MADPFEFLDEATDAHAPPPARAAQRTAHERLQAVRTALLAVEIRKSGFNGHLNFAYYELDDFLPQTITAMSEQGLVGIFNLLADRAELVIHRTDDPRDCVRFALPTALPANPTWQAIGAAQSYARRYLWRQALELVETDIVDSAESTLFKEVAKLIDDNLPKKAAERLAAATATDADLKKAVWSMFCEAERAALKPHLPKKVSAPVTPKEDPHGPT